MEEVEHEGTRCAVCEKVWRPGDAPTAWLFVEITRGDPDEPADVSLLTYLEESFCSQEHAAEWFTRPLPVPARPKPFVMSWRDRLAAGAVGLTFGLASLLLILGAVTAVRFLLEQF